MKAPFHSRPGADLAIAALVFAWLAATAWARLLMLPDEGRYVGVAWEMMRSGDWLVPTLNGLPYFHKPPLFYWITAASMSLFGLNEWAARAAPLLGAWIGALSLYFFVRRWTDRRTANLTLVALLAQPLFFGGAQFANLDMLVAGCITATIVLLAHAALCVERDLPCRTALGAAYAAAAFGVLAKGLIGLVIPALAVGAWLLVRRRWRVLLALSWWPGVMLFLIVAAPWFVAMQLRFADFFHYFFVVQHFQRFAAGGFNNVQPFWFYAAVLITSSLPWLPWLPWLSRLPIRQRYLSDPARGPVRLLMLLWVLMVVVFFSLPKSKLVGYIFPAVPPLAFLLAEGFALMASPSARSRNLWAVSTGAAAALGLGVVIWLSVVPARSSQEVALALKAHRGPGDAVVMLNEYLFDVPFYAELGAPVKVVDDWASGEIQHRDNWRKELADAARFDVARATHTLIAPLALPALLCDASVTWVIGSENMIEHYPFLKAAQERASRRGTTLWRLDATASGVGAALGCTGKSHVDLAAAVPSDASHAVRSST